MTFKNGAKLQKVQLAMLDTDVQDKFNSVDSIKGTTQSIIYNTDGTIQKVQHKDVNNNVLREDVFTYTTNLITEVRTLSSGGTLTFKYHLDTLETEVI